MCSLIISTLINLSSMNMILYRLRQSSVIMMLYMYVEVINWKRERTGLGLLGHYTLTLTGTLTQSSCFVELQNGLLRDGRFLLLQMREPPVSFHPSQWGNYPATYLSFFFFLALNLYCTIAKNIVHLFLSLTHACRMCFMCLVTSRSVHCSVLEINSNQSCWFCVVCQPVF